MLREELLTNGEEVFGCMRHGEMTGKCCSECGAKLGTIILEEPTDLLRRLRLRGDPHPVGWDDIGKLFMDLDVDYGEGKYDYKTRQDGPSPYIDLGTEISSTGSHRGHGDGREVFDPNDIPLAIAEVTKALKDGGLGHLEVKCYVVTTVSC